MKDKDLKQQLKDKEIYIVGLQYKIQELEHKLKNYESYQRERCCECDKESVVQLAEVSFELSDLKEKIKELIK